MREAVPFARIAATGREFPVQNNDRFPKKERRGVANICQDAGIAGGPDRL